MSREGVEKALYDLTTDRRSRKLFADRPDDFTGRYRLATTESESLLARDVRALAALGANPMLVWGFWLTCGTDRSQEAYLARMRGTDGPPTAKGE